MAFLARYVLCFVSLLIFLFSGSTPLIASATDADFQHCKTLSVEILQRCLSQSTNSGDPVCWSESKDAFRFCHQRIKKLYDVKSNDKRRIAEKQAQKNRLLKSTNAKIFTDNISITYPDKSKIFISFLNNNVSVRPKTPSRTNYFQ